jgi:Tol biopolymer transport system component
MRRLGWLIVEFAALLVSLAFVSGGSAQSGVLLVGRIAYAEKGICVVTLTADGRRQRCSVIRPSGADIYNSPAWSADGRRIAFQNLVECLPGWGCVNGIFVVDADGSDWRRVALAHGVSDQNPAWSPRGSKIAFSRWIFPDGSSGIYVADADRARVRRLYQQPVGQGGTLGLVDNPTWSPDGRQIAFSDGAAHLYLMNADGGRVRQLRFRGTHPLWSPDGRKMLVEAFVPDEDRAIGVIDARGTRLRIIARDAWDGTWSPDGRIAFSCNVPEPDKLDICLVNSDGTGHRRLVHGGSVAKASWSPNGEWISYVNYDHPANSAQVPTIRVMNVRSSAERRIAFPSAVNGTPVWQPKGR